MSWIKITDTDQIPFREGRSVKLGRHEVAIFNLGGRFAAMDNKCPHSGGPLCDGIVTGDADGFAVVCPLHGWKISLENGNILRPQVPVCVELYPVKVESGIIQIQFPDTMQSTENKEVAA